VNKYRLTLVNFISIKNTINWVEK